MADVTFIILTKNEEINIKDCLESIKNFAKRDHPGRTCQRRGHQEVCGQNL